MGTRIVALTLAALFLLTSVGFSIYTIYDANQNEDGSSASAQDNPVLAAKRQEILDRQQAEFEKQNPVQEEEDMGTIANFTPSSDKVTELQIIDTVVGEGQEVTSTDTVSVYYTGALVSDGSVFDTNIGGEPITFGLQGLIQGWIEGIPGMKPGGQRRLIIPAELAYGASARPGIPANSDLVFDIELVGIAQ